MFKFAVIFLFLSLVYGANVKRQIEREDRNPFTRYSNEDGGDVISEREWQRNREIERRNQRQRARDQQEARRYIVRWIEEDFVDNEQQRYEMERQQEILRQREAEKEYEQLYELQRNAQPYWTPYDDSQYVYPWGYPYVYV